MKKPKLDWYDSLLVRMLKRRGMAAASSIIEAAWPGYSIKKQRSDKGIKKGGGKDERSTGV